MTNIVKLSVIAVNRTGKAFRELRRDLNRSNSSVKNLASGIATLVGARQIQDYSDSYTNLRNRLQLVTESTREVIDTQQELFKVTQQSRVSFEENGQLFTRLALASKELGTSNRELLKVTKSINQAVYLSGASFREANAGLIQLSQGIASGTLRGDELRSVLEQIPLVADVIAKQMGVTRGELRELGSDGKISADTVIKAFQNAREELDTKFNNAVPSISQGWVRISNSIGKVVDEVNKLTIAGKNIASSLIATSDFLDKIFSDESIVQNYTKIIEEYNVGLRAYNQLLSVLAPNTEIYNQVLAKTNFLILAKKNALDSLKHAQKESVTEQLEINSAIDGTPPKLSALTEGLTKAEVKLKQFKTIARDSIETSLVQSIKNAESAKDIFKNLVNSLLAEALRLSVIRPLLNSIFAFATPNPATAITPVPKPIAPGRANGGLVSSGQPYTVGEQGRELFVPSSNGKVVSNDELQGNTIQNITINISAIDGASVERVLSSDEGKATIRNVTQELRFEQGLQ